MSEDDRRRWNAKYQAGEHGATTPSRLLTDLASYLPRTGRALDLAGGAGRNAIWLARQGLDVHLADVSDVALQLAASQAASAGVPLATHRVDLESEPLPAGPWDLILTVHFLSRPLFDTIPAVLARGGTLVVIHPTRKNLERFAKPPRKYLLEEGELPRLVRGLDIVHYAEGWLTEGRHEAVLVATSGPPGQTTMDVISDRSPRTFL